MKTEIKKLKAKYASQKNGAKRRGIEWELTFDKWLEWWGDDIEKRGSGHHQLQMQRYADKGPYAIGNIKKGYPKDNRATWSRVNKTKVSNKNKEEHERFLDALMFASSKEDDDETTEENYEMEMRQMEKLDRYAYMKG